MKEKKLPRAEAKRYGHRSTKSTVGRMIRTLSKGKFFESRLKREKQKYEKK